MARKTDIALDAMTDPKTYYNARFEKGYMENFDYDIYEACRLYTFRGVLGEMKSRGFSPSTILDYGCGQGRYIGELKSLFPKASVHGCDISDAGLQIAQQYHPDASLHTMNSEAIDYENNAFDLVISIEVLEHVQNVEKAVGEIGRVLKPGKTTVITTPCANRYSFEWFLNRWRGGLQPSPDGYGRFATDEPGHLRRLNDGHLTELLANCGVRTEKIYHRGHLFAMPAERLHSSGALPTTILMWLAMLDWYLFKYLPNGSTMLAVGTKKPAQDERSGSARRDK